MTTLMIWSAMYALTMLADLRHAARSAATAKPAEFGGSVQCGDSGLDQCREQDAPLDAGQPRRARRDRSTQADLPD
jgi:hypothetical protein